MKDITNMKNIIFFSKVLIVSNYLFPTILHGATLSTQMPLPAWLTKRLGTLWHQRSPSLPATRYMSWCQLSVSGSHRRHLGSFFFFFSLVPRTSSSNCSAKCRSRTRAPDNKRVMDLWTYGDEDNEFWRLHCKFLLPWRVQFINVAGLVVVVLPLGGGLF